jgi:hypothetical protein
MECFCAVTTDRSLHVVVVVGFTQGHKSATAKALGAISLFPVLSNLICPCSLRPGYHGIAAVKSGNFAGSRDKKSLRPIETSISVRMPGGGNNNARVTSMGNGLRKFVRAVCNPFRVKSVCVHPYPGWRPARRGTDPGLTY